MTKPLVAVIMPLVLWIDICVQSATEVLRRLDGRSYSIFRVCIAAGSSVTNGFSDRCLCVRRLVEASRLLCDCDFFFSMFIVAETSNKDQLFVEGPAGLPLRFSHRVFCLFEVACSAEGVLSAQYV